MKNLSWIFVSIMALLLAAILIILGFSLGLRFGNQIAFTDDTLSAWVSALATVCIAVLTIFLARETWALRQIQLTQIDELRKDSIKPLISLYLESSSAGFNLPNIHIANNGNGEARNVRFTFTNMNTNAQDVYDHMMGEFLKLSILKNGISALGAGQARTSYLFSFYDLTSKFKDKALEFVADVNITYEDTEGNKYSSPVPIDFQEYKGVSEIGDNPTQSTAKNLEKIARDVEGIAQGHRKISTNVYTARDRKKLQYELEKRIEESKKDSGNDS